LHGGKYPIGHFMKKHTQNAGGNTSKDNQSGQPDIMVFPEHGPKPFVFPRKMWKMHQSGQNRENLFVKNNHNGRESSDVQPYI
jgi:hypothetical protein